MVIVLFKYIPFLKNRKEKLYLLQMSNEPIVLRRLGYIMNELKPKTRTLKVKKSAFSSQEKYLIKNSIWDLKSDLRLFGLKRNHFVIIGTLGRKDNKKTLIECSLNKEQTVQIMQSHNVLATLNSFVDSATNSKIQEFKNTATASMITIEKFNAMKDEIISSLKNVGQGSIDALSIISEMYNLDSNEINADAIQDLIDQKQFREIQMKQIQKKGDNGNDELKTLVAEELQRITNEKNKKKKKKGE